MSAAKIILQQIKAGKDTRGLNRGSYLMMCWGANQLTATEQCLKFKVNCPAHRGWVEVTLNGLDLYDVEFYTLRRPRRNLKEFDFTPQDPVKKIINEYSNVDCESLTSIIDTTVEQG